jgi:Zn-finger nucleic acid-binding protein
MKCPLCEVDLHMTERHGIEIDYCPKCRGVWLDRGELDKIIERANPASYEARETREPHRDEPSRNEEHRSHDEHSRDDHKHKKKKSPASLLGDLFDF